jgi:PPOX class probable F420-dependent enzyme
VVPTTPGGIGTFTTASACFVGRTEALHAAVACRFVPRTIATKTAVDRAGLEEFVRPRHHAVLLTVRTDGSPQASLVTCGMDGAGRVVVSTYPERAKVHNARRRPEVSVVVMSDDFGGPFVQLDGTAEVLDLPDALEPLVDYYRCISGEHPDWDDYRAAMVAQGKSLLRITPTRWGPIATGGFPPRLAD